jgi:hypothetical protein
LLSRGIGKVITSTPELLETFHDVSPSSSSVIMMNLKLCSSCWHWIVCDAVVNGDVLGLVVGVRDVLGEELGLEAVGGAMLPNKRWILFALKSPPRLTIGSPFQCREHHPSAFHSQQTPSQKES